MSLAVSRSERAVDAAQLERMEFLTLDQLHVRPQVRSEFDAESLQGLAMSLAEVGQLQPIRIRLEDGKRFIVDGERRFQAAKLAGLKGLNCVVETRSLKDGEILLQQLIANIQREDLQPMEKAEGFSKLMTATGWNASEVAAKSGVSNGTVTRLLALLTLPESIRECVACGSINASAAYELSRVEDAGEQRAAQGVVEVDLTLVDHAGHRLAWRVLHVDGQVDPFEVTLIAGGRHRARDERLDALLIDGELVGAVALVDDALAFAFSFSFSFSGAFAFAFIAVLTGVTR